MGHYEEIYIDRKDGWKYQTTLGTNGDDYRAKVYIDDDGNIAKESYSREYNEKNGNNDKSPKGKEDDDDIDDEKDEKEGCLEKILLAPFRFLWWLIKFILKNALIILTFGIANGWFDDKDD